MIAKVLSIRGASQKKPQWSLMAFGEAVGQKALTAVATPCMESCGLFNGSDSVDKITAPTLQQASCQSSSTLRVISIFSTKAHDEFDVSYLQKCIVKLIFFEL